MTDENTTLPITTETEKAGESESTLSYPNTNMALYSMEAIAKHVSEELTAKDMLEILQSAMRGDPEGESMLFTQSQILDQLFHRLTINAMSDADKDGNPIKHYVNDKRIDLLLRLQKQCRTTLEAVHKIKEHRQEDFEEIIKKNHERTIINDIEHGYNHGT